MMVDVIEAKAVDIDIILQGLKQAFIDAQKADEETILAVVKEIKVILKITPNLIYFHSILVVNQAFRDPIDFMSLVLKCNEFNNGYFITSSASQDADQNIYFNTYYAIPFHYQLSMSDFIYQLMSFVASTSNALHELYQTFDKAHTE